MSISYFISILKEAAALEKECRPYNTGFNSMSLTLDNCGDDLVLSLSFPDSKTVASITDNGKEEGDMQSLMNNIREHIRTRRDFNPSKVER